MSSRSRGRWRRSVSWCRTWSDAEEASRPALARQGMAPGPLVILSGPTASGKSTVIQRLLADQTLPLRLSVSATTRSPRPNEQDGVHYHFWTRERFQRMIQADGFLEYAEVHGNLYGTPRSEVDDWRNRRFA